MTALRRLRLLGPTLGTTAALVLALAACSDDDGNPAPAGSSGTPPVTVDGGRTPEASVSQITPRPDLCEGLTLGGDPVSELRLSGEPPPPLGGALAPGTYDLVELDEYTGASPDPDAGEDAPTSGTTGRQAQASIVLTQFELRVAEARGAVGAQGEKQARALLYRTEGNYLIGTAVCPSTALPASMAYSAVGNGFAIFPDARHRELYVLRP